MKTGLIAAGIVLLFGLRSAAAGVGPGTWEELGPYARVGHALLDDAAHDRLLLVSANAAGRPGGEVWGRSLATSYAPWYRLASAGAFSASIPPRQYVVDPARDRLLVFFGATTTEVWALPLTGPATWSLLATSGTPPSPPLVKGVFYDAPEDRIVFYGGPDGGIDSAGLWELRLSSTPTWSQLVPSGTPPDSIVCAALDPVRRQLEVLASTADEGSTEVWENDLATLTWTKRATVPATVGLFWSAVTFDTQRARWVAVGGFDSVSLSDVNELPVDGSAGWTPVVAGGTLLPRMFAAAFYDEKRDRILVHGGQDGAVNNFSVVIRGDLMALSRNPGSSWTPLDGDDGLPLERHEHAAIVDVPGDRMIVFGGRQVEDAPPSLLGGAWAWPLDGTHAWQRLVPLGAAPEDRADCAAVFDPPRRRMVVFGGRHPENGPIDDGATWSLSLTDPLAWSVLVPDGSGPAPRSHPIAFYDPVGDRVILHGGFVPGSAFAGGDTWALALSDPPAWSPLPTGGTPTNASGFSVGAYDPVRRRLIALGRTNVGGEVIDNTLWSLSLGPSPAWTQLSPTGTPPAARDGATLVYEPGGDRMILDGGRSIATRNGLRDAWALDLAIDPPVWTQLWVTSPRTSRSGHSAVYDVARDRIVMFAGKRAVAGALSGGDSWQDLWALRWGAPVAVPVPSRATSAALRIVSLGPNPAQGPIRVRFITPGRAAVTLTLHDVRGRVVARTLVPQTSGEVVRTLERGRWAPGIYFVRVSEAGETATARVCVLSPR
jgi:hypothetical protein